MPSLYAIGAAAIALLASLLWGSWERGERISAQATAAAAAEALATTRATVATLQETAARQNEAITALASSATTRAASSNAIRRDVYAARRTDACLASPAAVAYVAGVRAAGPSRSPDRATASASGDAGLPAGAVGSAAPRG